MKTFYSFAAAAAAGMLVLGCGGGGDGAETQRVSGRVIDTYVSGATVFADLNGNGVRDSAEPSVQSDFSGRFTLANVPVGTMLYSIGGSETLGDVQRTVRFTMAAESSSDQVFITPLSTLADLSGDGKLVARLFGTDGGAAGRDPMQDAGTFLAAQQAALLLELYADAGTDAAALAAKLRGCESLDDAALQSCLGPLPEGADMLQRMRVMAPEKMSTAKLLSYEQLFSAYTQSVRDGFIPTVAEDLVTVVEGGESDALLRSWRTDESTIGWHGTVKAPPMPRTFGTL